MKSAVAKYLFGLIVVSYVITIIGIPVYFHYCGGELEEISYITKANNCCGDEEPQDDGCCKDEGHIIKSNPDFTHQHSQKLSPSTPVHILFFSSFFSKLVSPAQKAEAVSYIPLPPPKLQEEVLSITVLRI